MWLNYFLVFVFLFLGISNEVYLVEKKKIAPKAISKKKKEIKPLSKLSKQSDTEYLSHSKLKQQWEKAYLEYKRNISICEQKINAIAKLSKLNLDYLYLEYCALQIPKVEDPSVMGWEEGINAMSLLSDIVDSRIFLELDGVKINQLKPSVLLQKEEVDAYRKMLYKQLDFKNFKDLQKKTDGKIEDGMDLLRHIHYSHLIFLMKKLLNEKLSLMGEESTVILDYDLIKGPKSLNFMKIFDKMFSNKESEQKLESKEEEWFSYAKLKKLTFEETQKNRDLLTHSFLGGLVNFDPQVRLFSVYMLRRLVPNVSIWDFVSSRVDEVIELQKEELENFNLDNVEETVQYSIYEYKNLDWKSTYGIIYDQLVFLKRFISRFILVNSIQKGFNTDLISRMNEPLFAILARSIDGESFCRIPIYYFSSKEEIESLYEGLLNNVNEDIQNELLKALSRFLLTSNIDFDFRFDIFQKLIKSDFYKYFLKDWTLAEKDAILTSNENLAIVFKIYLKENPSILACSKWSADQYDESDSEWGESAKVQNLVAKVNPLKGKDYYKHLPSFLSEVTIKQFDKKEELEEVKEEIQEELEETDLKEANQGKEPSNKVVEHFIYENDSEANF